MRMMKLLASVSALTARAFDTVFEQTAETCEIVIIEGPEGPVRVNKSDFDADQASDSPKMKLATVSDAPAEPVKNETPAQLLVSKEGTGAKAVFFVTDAQGVKVTGEGITETGYASEADAWAAIMALAPKG